MTRPTIVIVCGGREYASGNRKAEQDHIWATLDSIRAHYGEIMVVEGGAPGADTWAGLWADDRGVHCAVVRANWRRLGKGAGPRRNAAMLRLSPDICVAFPGGVGTANMVAQAREAGVPVYEV